MISPFFPQARKNGYPAFNDAPRKTQQEKSFGNGLHLIMQPEHNYNRWRLLLILDFYQVPGPEHALS